MRRGHRSPPARRCRTSPLPTGDAATSCRRRPTRRAAPARGRAGWLRASCAGPTGSAPPRGCTTGSLREVLREGVLPEPGVGRRLLVRLDRAQHLAVGGVARHGVARLRQLVVAPARALAADVATAAAFRIGVPVVALAVA